MTAHLLRILVITYHRILTKVTLQNKNFNPLFKQLVHKNNFTNEAEMGETT